MNDNLKKIFKHPFVMKIINGFSWVAGGNILSKVLISLGYILIAKILSVEEYGEFGILKSTIDNFLIFTTMGISFTSTKYIAELKNEHKDDAGSILGASLLVVSILGAIICLAIILLAEPISINILKAPHLKNLLIYVSIILLFTSIVGVQQGALIGLQSFKALSISYIAQGILIFGGIVAGAYIYKTTGVIVGYLIAFGLLFFITQYFLNRELVKNGINISLNNFKSSFKTIYLFAIPASLATVIAAPTNWYLNASLAGQPNGYYEMGLFSATVIFSMGLRNLNTSLGSVLLPIFLSDNSKSKKKEFVNYFLIWIVSIVVSLPFLIYPEIIQLILGDKYPSEKIISICTLTFLTSIIIGHRHGISRDIIQHNKMWTNAFGMLIWALSSVVFFYLLKGYGAYGLALAITLGYVVNFIVFVPICIYLKLTPRYVFYNKYIAIIFVLLFLFFVSNQFITELYLRLVLNIINAIVLLFFLYRFTIIYTNKDNDSSLYT